MGLTSLQMDPSDWLQGTMSDDGGLDSSSPSSVDMLACSRPLMERRLRPPLDQALNCPRCDSTNTKFCYYNNYSLTQPRYFCKTCRRYWTKGGTLRNIPVGGGCRKNRKQSSSSASKKPSVDNQSPATVQNEGFGANPTELQLSFPEVQLSQHLTSLIGAHGTGFLDSKYNALLDRQNYDGFLASKFDALVGHGANATTRAHDLLGSGGFGVDFGHNNYIDPISSSSASSLFGHVSINEGNSSSAGVLESSYQRLMLQQYDYHNGNSNGHENFHQSGNNVDVKPSPRLLSLQWQDHGNGGAAGSIKEHFGYDGGFNGLSSWGGNMFNGYIPPSATNPLI